MSFIFNASRDDVEYGFNMNVRLWALTRKHNIGLVNEKF